MNDINLSSLILEERQLMSGQYWDELQIFAAVAHGRSFNRAAQSLGLSQPTISRKVKRLQDVLGAKLFLSTKQGVQLTERGEELAAAVFQLDRSLFALTRDLRLRAADAEGVVGIAAPDELLPLIVKANLVAFATANPRVTLQFKRMSAPTEWRGNGTDIALAPSSLVTPDCASRRIGRLVFVPAAAPTYLNQRGLPTPNTLAGHTFLQGAMFSSSDAGWAEWQAMCASAGSTHECSSGCAYTALATDGMGIALVARHRLPSLGLTAIDLGFEVGVDLHLAALRDRTDVLPGKAVLDWLSDHLESAYPIPE